MSKAYSLPAFVFLSDCPSLFLIFGEKRGVLNKFSQQIIPRTQILLTNVLHSLKYLTSLWMYSFKIDHILRFLLLPIFSTCLSWLLILLYPPKHFIIFIPILKFKTILTLLLLITTTFLEFMLDYYRLKFMSFKYTLGYI